MTAQIKLVARRHLATDGANLSLRAIARDLGMVSSAIYRYFPSRDELLTALIIDAYNDLGEAAEHADATIADRADARSRWMSVSRALRAWALSNPVEYALLYGTPVPGYAAPTDTTAPASRPVVVLGSILADARRPLHGREFTLGPALETEIRRIADIGAPKVGDSAMVRGLMAWTLLFGALNFELFGRINNVIDQRDEWFDQQMQAMVDYIGL
jgi:AcrR family transcriptional regulator